jgi:hypothetical protein
MRLMDQFDERLGDFALVEKSATSDLPRVICPTSRFYAHLPKT